MQKYYHPTRFESVWALSTYKNTSIRALIHEAKFYHNKQAQELLSNLLQLHINTAVTDIDVIIPIPLSSSRMRTRGYNQVTEILKSGSLHTQYTILTDVLIRTRNTQPQTELQREKRLTNLHDAFMVIDGTSIQHKHVLLIDDVTTTGTTLGVAKDVLMPHCPASLTCIALAH